MSEEKPMYAEVALPLPLEKTFHYSVPPALRSRVLPGARVLVPFGKKTMTGYVTALVPETGVPGVKDILSALDAEPAITDELFSLARWMSGNYLCSFGEALATIASPALKAPKRQPRPADAPPSCAPGTGPALTAGQAAAVDAVKKTLDRREFGAFLVHGVTSSGKTEVYLSLIAEVLASGRSAVFLLPEISLTPQFIAIVRKRFPGIVGVWHSKLSAGERYRTWDAARLGKIRIMMGARSALFAPFRALGVIIVDEEHEPTYKQEQKPAYQTRDAAMERARINKAAVVFGSATPSLELYYRAKSGALTLLELGERIDGRTMPPVRIVDPSRLWRGSRILAAPVVSALTRTLARREQAIIFLNRRGFSPAVMCHGCGEVWQCPHCSVSLVYHTNPATLRCHYCDYHEPWPGICPKCKSRDIAVFGVGTQKVEEELKRLFPQGRVFRLDRDTASRKGVYEKAYDDFKQENVDILLGTQMVAKGFDFPRVTFVGVVDADTALYLPDFRSAERTFQLLTQVAGRSGRSDLGGEVVVQSRHPEHYALAAARNHDYASFYRQEIEFRRQMNYPPFCRLVNVLFRGRNEERVAEAAQRAGENFLTYRSESKASIEILGPSPAARLKMHNLFRWQMLLKGELASLLDAVRAIRKSPLPSGVMLSVDVDPQDTL